MNCKNNRVWLFVDKYTHRTVTLIVHIKRTTASNLCLSIYFMFNQNWIAFFYYYNFYITIIKISKWMSCLNISWYIYTYIFLNITFFVSLCSWRICFFDVISKSFSVTLDNLKEKNKQSNNWLDRLHLDSISCFCCKFLERYKLAFNLSVAVLI